MKRFMYLAALLLSLIWAVSCNDTSTPNQMLTPTDNEALNNLSKGAKVLSDEMRVNPYRIILNTRSTTNYVKTMFGGTIPSGYRIYTFNIELFIEEIKIANATEFDYCYTDAMFTVTYNKSTIVNNSFVRSLAGNTVAVISTGTYTLINNYNQIIQVDFTKYGTAQILENW